ncbi:chondroadherin-like protein [Schistocerca piceifrons]|uniref:chondroadherin-like protein n=1 Tax=Schistocerca piceifrons TaxID=274613 RepID=UPI001F5F6940|nr:chondroadherin-like protein [Schistocerca piceifrons]
MGVRLAAWSLLVVACGWRAEAACQGLAAREGDVTVHCDGVAPDWTNLTTATSGVEVRGLQLPQLGPDFLAGHVLPQLTHLYLPHNQIRTVLENATVGLPGLLTLDLSHNRLERLEAGALVGSPQLETLVLSHNHLLSLAMPLPHDWAFLLPLTQLSHLQVRHCSLTSVPEAALEVLSDTAPSAELDTRGNPSAGPHCRQLRQRMRYSAAAPRLLCDAARASRLRRPPSLLVVLWCVVAIVSVVTALACLWRWRYGKGASTGVPYRRFFTRGSVDA